MNELRKEISRIYERLQGLQVQPTRSNVAILADALMTLEKIYKALPEESEVVEDVSDRSE